MRASRIILAHLLLITFFNCKEKVKSEANKTSATVEYKYQDNTNHGFLQCDHENKELLEEALFSFEEDIIKRYDSTEKKLVNAYPRFVNAIVFKKLDMDSLVTQHSKDIADVLKNDSNLWLTKEHSIQLNYNNPLFSCIGKQIGNKDLEDTYDLLMRNNTMNFRMFSPILRKNAHMLIREHHLALFVALDLYYTKILNKEKFGIYEDPKVEKFKKAGSYK